MAITYSISGGVDAALFKIDATTGVLTFKVAPDFENPGDANKDNVYEVTVKATDPGGATTTQNLRVTVTDVIENTNLPPEFTSSGAVNVAENTTSVITVVAVDPDATTPPIEPPPTGGDPTWSDLDGRANAPVVASGPQFRNVLNSYGGAGKRDMTIGPPYQPPWMVSGVDYPVGINDAAKPLKNVTTATLPSGVTRSGSSITISGNNVVLDGYDFSGSFLKITGDNNTVSNCLFKWGSNYGYAVAVDFLGANNKVIYCEFDGLKNTSATQTIQLSNNSGTATVMYCYFHEWNDDFMRLQNTPAAGVARPCQWIIKYNAFWNGGCSGVHFDVMQTVMASYSLIDWTFNFAMQGRPSGSSGNPQSASAFRNSDFIPPPNGFLGLNACIAYCTIIAGGDHSGDSAGGGHSGFSNWIVFSPTSDDRGNNKNSLCHDCYFDLSGLANASGVFNTFGGGAVNAAQYNNWDMAGVLTRNSANPPGYITQNNPWTDSLFSATGPARMAAPTLTGATKSGSAVAITGTAPARPSGGKSGNYLVNVFATDLAWPASLISAGTVSVAPGAAISLTTGNLPAGAHSIAMYVVDGSWTASPLSAAINVTV